MLQDSSPGIKLLAWPTLLDIGWPPQHRLALVGVVQLLVALYQFYVVRRLRYSGLHRLLASLPSLVVLTSFACLFNWRDEVLLRTSILFTCSWLGTFKVVGACMNRGPLAQEENRSFMQFFMLLYLPIYPSSEQNRKSGKLQGRLQDISHSPAALLLYACLKIALLVFVTWCIQNVEMPTFVKSYFYTLALVGFLGVLMDAPASVATSLVGLSIIPTFDAPWLSSSLADFWGRRWNITTSAILRTVIYDPIVEGTLVRPRQARSEEPSKAAAAAARTAAQEPAPASANGHAENGHDSPAPAKATTHAPRVAKWRRVVGTFATFLVSGLVHEYIINMVNPPLPDGSLPWFGKWTAFFTLQAPMLLTEVQLKKWWKQKGFRQPNIWLSRVLATGLLILVAGPLFFGPCDTDSDLANRATTSVLSSASYLSQEAKLGAQQLLASFHDSGLDAVSKEL